MEQVKIEGLDLESLGKLDDNQIGQLLNALDNVRSRALRSRNRSFLVVRFCYDATGQVCASMPFVFGVLSLLSLLFGGWAAALPVTIAGLIGFVVSALVPVLHPVSDYLRDLAIVVGMLAYALVKCNVSVYVGQYGFDLAGLLIRTSLLLFVGYVAHELFVKFFPIVFRRVIAK